MMSDKKAVKVGDMVSSWHLSLPEYDGCEFKAFAGSPRVEITKVPDPKPEVPDEPRTRGDVVTIEGNDEFIAVLFSESMPYPFLYTHSATGDNDINYLVSWDNIVTLAAGRKIIVHKTVGPNEAPVKVDTYAEWVAIPEEERKKYKWRDVEGDLWFFSDRHGEFAVYEGDDNIYTLDDDEFFPLFRDEKIG